MLVEFSVSNYRSLRDRQVLSMVADADKSLADTNCEASGMTAAPQLVRAAVLYGANASGKSNLIMALSFMRAMIETSATGILEGQTLNVSPFCFDDESATKPTEFEAIFIDNDVRYQYGFAASATHVLKEWLLVYAGRKAQRWFERDYDETTKKDRWYFGSHLIGGKQRQLWSESTRSNALFLSTAVNLNSEQLRPIFNWFVNKLVILGSNIQFNISHTMEMVRNEHVKPQILDILQCADLGITDVQIKEEKAHQTEFRFGATGEPLATRKEATLLTATLYHTGKNGKKIGLPLQNESHGTQKFFTYAGPIRDVLQDGKVLVVDELDTSLHPKMVQFLLGLVQNSGTNKAKVQLIFTTHNTALLDMDYFRRDQVWFMEKDRELASHLYPLTDFSPRKGEALEKGYMLGRYGALPIFGEFKL